MKNYWSSMEISEHSSFVYSTDSTAAGREESHASIKIRPYISDPYWS